jgi:ribose 5-phosphate isomerase B
LKTKDAMKIALACDHAGYKLKLVIKEYLEGRGHQIMDFGAFSAESSDYPDFAHPLAEAIEQKRCEIGISMCGSGNGISITANKHAGIRSALCWNTEVAKLARQHNDANICALPARFIQPEQAIKIVDIFLGTEFQGGRHKRRIDKIPLRK